MQAVVKSVRDILLSGNQYLVPFFQRHYSWRRDNWQRLLDDIVVLTQEANETEHFLGPLVCTPFHPIPGEVTPFQLIDGQQRLTTLTLALAALRDVAKLKGLPELANEINEKFLIHPHNRGHQRLKVVPRLGDRTPYEDVIESRTDGAAGSEGILAAYSFFKRKWKLLTSDAGDAELKRILIATTTRLNLVTIIVDAENPYEIFESLNSTGLPLEEADLIRNYLFMQVPLDEQNEFHTRYWEPFEKLFDATGDYEKLPSTLFYRSYLMRDGTYCRNKAAYVEFKKQNGKRAMLPAVQVEELTRFAKFELWLRRPSSCADGTLRALFAELQALDITTAHPLLLNLLNRHEQGRLSPDDLLGCFKDLSSFVLRRSICGESTRAYGRWFPDAVEKIHLHPRQDLRAYWLEKGWPDDHAFIPRLQEFPIYKRERNKCLLLLQALEEQFGHKEELNLRRLNIEHVMPQTLGNDDPGESWRKMLGADWKALHEKWLHALGNLTLTGYNSELGNSSFGEKQNGFSGSNVSLNRHFAKVAKWSEQEIKERGNALARQIAELWPRPSGGPAYNPPNAVSAEQVDLLDGSEPTATEPRPQGRSKIRIQVRWSLLDKASPDEGFGTSDSGETMANFLGALIRAFGDSMAELLSRLPVSRNHPLSTNPRMDFLNPVQGKPYAHKLVPGTGLYVFTNTSNQEKRDNIRELVKQLGFPAESVEVSIIPGLSNAALLALI